MMVAVNVPVPVADISIEVSGILIKLTIPFVVIGFTRPVGETTKGGCVIFAVK
jgi:hypothetical protein